MKTIEVNFKSLKSWVSVESSNLKAVTTAKDVNNNSVLLVAFNNGDVYTYDTGKQTNSLYVAICTGSVGSSAGKTFNTFVRNKFNYTKL